jgi:hypothetical protein
MKNLKLVSYQEWSNIYESLNKDSKATQRVLESKLTGIYEAVLTQTNVTFPEGLVTDKHTRKTFDGLDSFGNDLEITMADNQTVYETAIRTVDSVPGATFLYAGAITNAAKNVALKLNVFKLIIAGIGNSVGIEKLADELIKDPTLMENLKLKATLDKTFKTFGKDGLMYTDAKLSPAGVASSTGTDKNLTKPSIVCGILNTQNLVNWVNGSFSQVIDLSPKIGGSGVGESFYGFGSSVADDSPEVDSATLYLFTSASSGEGSAEPVAQPTSAPSRGVSIPWAQLDFTYDEDGTLIDERYSEIKELIKQIVSELAPNEVITKLQLTSVVNPMWNGQTTSGNGTGEPVGQNSVKLTDATFKTDKTALGNQWLAWKRGSEIATELYESLGGKIQKNAIEVMWKIGQTSATIPNITYSIVAKTTSPSNIANTPAIDNALGTQAVSANANIPISRYKITFDGSVIAKALPGKLKKVIGIGASTIAYEDLSAGDSIKYKGMTDGKIDDKSVKKGKVLSISDGKVTLESETGNKLTISKNRFISGGKETKAGTVMQE